MLLKQNSSALSIKFAHKIDYKNNPEQQLLKTTCKKCQATLGNLRETPQVYLLQVALCTDREGQPLHLLYCLSISVPLVDTKVVKHF